MRIGALDLETAVLEKALTDLDSVYGRPAATALATAYESAILSISFGEWDAIPDRSTRLALVEAIMSEGELNGFVPERMTEAGLAAVAARP